MNKTKFIILFSGTVIFSAINGFAQDFKSSSNKEENGIKKVDITVELIQKPIYIDSDVFFKQEGVYKEEAQQIPLKTLRRKKAIIPKQEKRDKDFYSNDDFSMDDLNSGFLLNKEDYNAQLSDSLFEKEKLQFEKELTLNHIKDSILMKENAMDEEFKGYSFIKNTNDFWLLIAMTIGFLNALYVCGFLLLVNLISFVSAII